LLEATANNVFYVFVKEKTSWLLEESLIVEMAVACLKAVQDVRHAKAAVQEEGHWQVQAQEAEEVEERLWSP